MNLKHSHVISCSLLAATLLGGSPSPVSAQSDEQIIETARATIKAERQAALTEAMQFTATEGQDFWPIYQQYRVESDKVGDGLKKLVLEYAQLYPDVPADRAKQMLKELTALERKQVDLRASCLKKVGKVLPAAKTLRFAQVDSRLDLAVRLELAANIPLVPVAGRIMGRTTTDVGFVAGQVGGVLVSTFELQATVVALDPANRKVTLMSADGFKQTVKVGPDAINFGQIQVGDQLKVTATEELVVAMGTKAEADDAAAVVALAPPGAKPGGLMAEVRNVTAQITAIDAQKRTATLRFEDGTQKTLPVRNDVDLTQHKIGDRVVFRVTEMIAVSMTKP